MALIRRVVAKEVEVNGVLCDNTSCGAFAELDGLARMPYGWITVQLHGYDTSLDLCSESCLRETLERSMTPAQDPPAEEVA